LGYINTFENLRKWANLNEMQSAATSNVAASLIIAWTRPYTLQSVTNIPGPFNDLTIATSPFTNTNTLPQQFFRLRQ
jgi:hypothetical protein